MYKTNKKDSCHQLYFYLLLIFLHFFLMQIIEPVNQYHLSTDLLKPGLFFKQPCYLLID